MMSGKDTKQLIANGFRAVSRKKELDKVTVKDIVEHCHISRQTFYYHFQDMTEVMEWMLRQTMDQVLEESLKAETPQEALYTFVSTIAEQTQGILPKLMNSQRRAQLEVMILKAVRTYLQEMMHNKLSGLQVNYGDLQVAIDFYSYGITGLLLEYSAQNKIQAEQLTEQIYQLINGTLLQAVLHEELCEK